MGINRYNKPTDHPIQIMNSGKKKHSLTFSSLVVDSGWGKGLSWWVVSTTEGSSILFLIIGVARGDRSRGI